jgi:hypothetical protein
MKSVYQAYMSPVQSQNQERVQVQDTIFLHSLALEFESIT